ALPAPALSATRPICPDTQAEHALQAVSVAEADGAAHHVEIVDIGSDIGQAGAGLDIGPRRHIDPIAGFGLRAPGEAIGLAPASRGRESTRLNSSHVK